MKVFEKPLSEQEEKEMLIRSRNGDIEARNILVEKNMRLVAHMIKKYACAEKDTQDLISVGTIGLIKAVNTFNPDKKIRQVSEFLIRNFLRHLFHLLYRSTLVLFVAASFL